MAKRLRLFRTKAHETVDPTVRAELLVPDGPAQRYLLRLMMESARDNPPGTPRTDDHHSRPEWMHELVGAASKQERSEFDEWASIAIVADVTTEQLHAAAAIDDSGSLGSVVRIQQSQRQPRNRQRSERGSAQTYDKDSN